MIDYNTLRTHAHQLAAGELATTASLTAAGLKIELDAARAALRQLAETGYLRPVSVPGLGNKIAFQPTLKAAGLRTKNVPKFLRSGLDSDAINRGLLRSFIRQISHPNLSFLTTKEQSELCKKHDISERGHARVLAGLDGAHVELFVPISHREAPISAIESASNRWFFLLETGTATLNFVTDGAHRPAVIEAIKMLNPPDPAAQIRAELAALEAQIKADTTGKTAIISAQKLTGMRRELAEISGQTAAHSAPFRGLAKSWGHRYESDFEADCSRFARLFPPHARA